MARGYEFLLLLPLVESGWDSPISHADSHLVTSQGDITLYIATTSIDVGVTQQMTVMRSYEKCPADNHFNTNTLWVE